MSFDDGMKGPEEAPDGIGSRRALAAWCLYDWANSVFPTLIVTFVFAVYFTQGIAETPEEGTALWGTMTGLTALAVALLAPMIGAVADSGGRRKPWLFVFTAVTVLSAAGLWSAEPGAASVPLTLLLVGLGIFGFEVGMVFYNAMLPSLAPKQMTGRISGWGWGLGYAGGLASLAVALVTLVLPEEPWFGLSKDGAEHLRAVPVLAAVWMAVFAIPLFLWVPDRRPIGNKPLGRAVAEGLATLVKTLRRVKDYGTVWRYLLARMLYTDGLNTLFAFGGIFAAAAFGMEQTEVLFFGIALNVTAGLGAVGFAFLDDFWGSKPVILTSVAAITLIGGAMLLTRNEAVFWALGLALGAFLGPSQAASRTLMAKLAPPGLRTEFFGLYALSGKATAFLGPLLLGWVTVAADSQRWGMATVLVFLVAGWLLLARLKIPD